MAFDSAKVRQEYEAILTQLGDPELISNWQKFQELTERKNYLEKIIDKDKEIREIKNKIEENKIIISGDEDKELMSLAQAEIVQLGEKEKAANEELEQLLASETGGEQEKNGPSKAAANAVIVEIRAGTGGEEAALFAGDLLKMYSRYAENQGWKQKVLDSNPTEIGGFKEVVFELKNGDVFSKMRYEAGVHRVQRIPTTEKSGRVHTSTASVAVFPKPQKTQIQIRPSDLKIDVYKSSGPGGQYVNKRETAIRITHLPTGLVVTSQTERNLQQNKVNAMSILEARLFEMKEKNEMEKMGKVRRKQIGTAERAEKIRTYNFPQDRLTDHRTKKSWHNLAEIMNGKLDLVIETLRKNAN